MPDAPAEVLGSAVARLDGGWLVAAAPAGVGPLTAMTLELWLRPERLDRRQTLIAVGPTERPVTLALEGGRYRFGNRTLAVTAPVEPPTPHGWRYVAAACDGRAMGLYPGGEAGSVRPAGCRIHLGESAWLGALPARDGVGECFTGELARVRVWAVARDAEAIRRDRLARSAAGPGLLADWPLDEGFGALGHNRAATGYGSTLRHGDGGYRIALPG